MFIVEDRLLQAVILEVNSRVVQFKLAPTYTLYLAVRRLLLSAHSAHLVAGFASKTSKLIKKSIQVRLPCALLQHVLSLARYVCCMLCYAFYHWTGMYTVFSSATRFIVGQVCLLCSLLLHDLSLDRYVFRVLYCYTF